METKHGAQFFGEAAIERGYATRDQVVEALKEQYRLRCIEKRQRFLGEVMVESGVLSVEQFAELMNACRGYHETPLEQRQKVFFGDVAVQLGFISPGDLFRALQHQRDDDARGGPHRLVGEILLDDGFLTGTQVAKVISTVVEFGYSDYRTGQTPLAGDPLPGFVPAGMKEV
jgi:hypothetical protein